MCGKPFNTEVKGMVFCPLCGFAGVELKEEVKEVKKPKNLL